MKQELSITNPKRLFTFGCSFTNYKWATWANILAYELGCEFYNFGKSGAGNAFIANQITQANRHFEFTKDDLIVVCWTNISREDRYTYRNGWITPGNIYSQQEYDNKFIKQWANETHFALRDYAYIDLIDSYLSSKTNYHFISMCDITRHINQWEDAVLRNKNLQLDNLIKAYKPSLDKIAVNFYDALWQGNMDYKWNKDWREIHPNFSDGHPTIKEHLEYLQTTFDYEFSQDTINKVNKNFSDLRDYIREGYKNTKKACGLHEMGQQWEGRIRKKFLIRAPEPNPPEIFH